LFHLQVQINLHNLLNLYSSVFWEVGGTHASGSMGKSSISGTRGMSDLCPQKSGHISKDIWEKVYFPGSLLSSKHGGSSEDWSCSYLPSSNIDSSPTLFQTMCQQQGCISESDHVSNPV
jgi:hypothetical protein